MPIVTTFVCDNEECPEYDTPKGAYKVYPQVFCGECGTEADEAPERVGEIS